MKTLFNYTLLCMTMSVLFACSQKKGMSNNTNADKDESDIKTFVADKTPSDLVNNFYYRIIEFPTTPSAKDQAVLKSPGIQILEYIPDNSYLVSISTTFNKELLLTTAAETIKKVPAVLKTNNQLKSWNIPNHAAVGSKAKVAVITMKGLRAKAFQSNLNSLGLTVDNYGGDAKFVYLTLSESEVKSVAQLPWVRYIEIIDEEGVPEPGEGEE